MRATSAWRRTNAPELRTGTAGDLPVLEPLWVAVHHRHAQTKPQLAPYVSDGDTRIPDTWQTGARIGEIESLNVLPEYRGSGLGSVLLDRLETHRRARGAQDLILGALPGNADAIRLYERRGYQPTWLYLSRFEGRD